MLAGAIFLIDPTDCFDMRSLMNARHASVGVHCDPGQPSDARCGSRSALGFSASAQDLRFRVLRLLELNPKLSHREIARSLGVSTGRANYCLNALIELGAIKVRNFRDSKNKLRYTYLLTPRGLAEKSALTGDFLARKLEEYEAIRAEIEDLLAELDGGAGDIIGLKKGIWK